MGNIFDLDSPTRIAGFARRVPGPVRRLDAGPLPGGTLLLRWKAPLGGTFITAYRIERTREGRDYELLGETTRKVFFVRNPPVGEPWFYRVTAFNARGAGGFRLVWLFRRGDRFIPGGQNQNDLLTPIAVVPGLQVNIWE